MVLNLVDSSLPLKRMTSSFHVLDDVGPHNNNNLLTDKQMYPKMTSPNTMTMFLNSIG